MIDMDYNLRSILHLSFRQKFSFLLVFLLITVPGYLFVLSLNPYYETRGSVLLNFGNNVRPELNLEGGGYKIRSSNENSVILKSNVKILQSFDLIKKTVTVFGYKNLYKGLLASEKTEEKLIYEASSKALTSFRVEAGKDNNLIEIFFKHEDPQIASDFANALLLQFKTRHSEIYEAPQIHFLETQGKESEGKLKESQDAFKTFKKQMGVSGIDQEIEQLLKQKNDLSIVSFQSIARAQETLAAMEAKEAEMNATYQDGSSVMKSLRESIHAARRQLEERQIGMSNLNLEGDVNTFSKQTASIDERLVWLEEQRGQYNEFERQIELNEKNAQYYRQRTEEARVNARLNSQDITRVAVVDIPHVPLRPSGPKKLLLLVAIIFLAGFFACSTVIVNEILDDRFSLPNQIKSRLGIPVLATFETIEYKKV